MSVGLTGSTLAERWLAEHGSDLVAARRWLHAHPELGRQEHRTTEYVCEQLADVGLKPRQLAGGTGAVCDIGTGAGPTVLLRADIDALPLPDEKDVAYRSTVPGVCHACGHDVHTAVLLGTGLALAAVADELPGRVRLLFQHAEELMPGGALDVIAEGLLDGVDSAFALHCDPALEVGRVGLRSGPITAASDHIEVRLTGPGGHTSRPHNTVDLVHALATVATGLPDALSRLVDPRAGLCLVWGHVAAGTAPNAIPREGLLHGTLRMLDKDAWHGAPDMVHRLVDGLVAPYGARAHVTYNRGVPPVVNDQSATALMAAAVRAALGTGAAVPTTQSLGGEDFAWCLEQVPGALGRLGVKAPGRASSYDLHQGSFDVDEEALPAGVRVMTAVAP
ncbi:MAG TPA: amidohydrolase, partial [Mycobacteriales bacterium]|nr:amidohydrolase [Mycobacteriales bacterium]